MHREGKRNVNKSCMEWGKLVIFAIPGGAVMFLKLSSFPCENENAIVPLKP